MRANREIEKIPHIKQVVDAFLSKEVVSSATQSYSLGEFELFGADFENSDAHHSNLRRMLLQHNIRVMSLYYNLVNIRRMAELTGGSAEETED